MKKTPLHRYHVDSGANMAEFCSYSMPLWYPGGAKNEHIQVIQKAGLFDTSHMAVLLVKGESGRILLQHTLSKDLESCIGAKKTALVPKRSVYGVFLNQKAHVIDDAIVFQVKDDLFMVVVNCGMGGVIRDHLSSFSENLNVQIVDLTDKLGKIDIQGPASAKIIKKVLKNSSEGFKSFPFFSFQGWFDVKENSDFQLLDDTPILLSRTGYTGEFGFEIFLAPEKLLSTWQMLLEAGGDDLIPCGLAARDSLRAGAVLPLSHQDIGDWPFLGNPWLFALPLNEDGSFSKNFVGSDFLNNAGKDLEFTYPFAGFDPRKINRGSAVLDAEGNAIGKVLTCVTDMGIGRVDDEIVSLATPVNLGRPVDFSPRGLCCGFIKVSKKLEYNSLVLLSDGKRKLKVEIRQDIRPHRSGRKPFKDML